MSWGTNNAVSNNIHFNFPSIMNDSRLYTDYNSNAIIDKNIKKINNIKQTMIIENIYKIIQIKLF